MNSKNTSSRIEGLSSDQSATTAEVLTLGDPRITPRTFTSPTIKCGSRRKDDGQVQIEPSQQTSPETDQTSISAYYSNATTPFQNHLKQSTPNMPVKTDMSIQSAPASQKSGYAAPPLPWEDQPQKAETHDQGKAPLAQLPWAAVEALSRVQLFGHKKYKDFNNYRKGMEVTRNLSCALRHIKEYLEGHDKDAESGESPLAHALCRVAFVLQNMHDNTAIDDRYNANR